MTKRTAQARCKTFRWRPASCKPIGGRERHGQHGNLASRIMGGQDGAKTIEVVIVKEPDAFIALGAEKIVKVDIHDEGYRAPTKYMVDVVQKSPRLNFKIDVRNVTIPVCGYDNALQIRLCEL
jgi:hypothetical protein